MASLGSFPSSSSYVGAKAALDAASDSLRAELRPYNVRVYDVLPGLFPTNIHHSSPAWADNPSNRGDAALGALSKIYTDPSQGYDSINLVLRSKLHGEPEKFARRVYEIVAEVGLAKEILGNYDDHPTWTRIPMGGDATTRMYQKAMDIAANVKAYEALSRSTDAPVEEEGIKEPTAMSAGMLKALF